MTTKIVARNKFLFFFCSFRVRLGLLLNQTGIFVGFRYVISLVCALVSLTLIVKLFIRIFKVILSCTLIRLLRIVNRFFRHGFVLRIRS